MEALCDANGTVMPDIDADVLEKFKAGVIELEIDLLSCSRDCICLTEVKSNPSLGFKALEQLERAEKIIQILLRIIGLGEKKINICKLVAVPPPVTHQLKKKAKVFTIDSIADNEKTIDEIHPKSDEQPAMTEEELNLLVASLIFMKCTHYYPMNSKTTGNSQIDFVNQKLLSNSQFTM